MDIIGLLVGFVIFSFVIGVVALASFKSMRTTWRRNRQIIEQRRRARPTR